MLWVATRCLFVTVNQIILLVVYITQMQSLNWYMHCSVYLDTEILMSLCTRMPLLMLEPKLHVITIGECGFWGQKVTNVYAFQWPCK